MNTTKLIAKTLGKTWASALFLVIFISLAGCANPLKLARPALYDFGPGPLAVDPNAATTTHAPVILGTIEATAALDSLFVHYRLGYADGQQLKPYSQAIWSMAPAQLIRQRLNDKLGQTRALLNPGESDLIGTAAPATLRIDLEEFSQLFVSPTQSVGLIRLRVTLIQPNQNSRVVQRSVVAQRPAPSADAAGGVQALTAATDAAVQEIDTWLRLQAP